MTDQLTNQDVEIQLPVLIVIVCLQTLSAWFCVFANNHQLLSLVEWIWSQWVSGNISHLWWHWATSLFDLDFRWDFAEPKLRSKYLLKSKSEVISLRLTLSLKYLLRPTFGLSEKSQQFAESKSTYLDQSWAELTWLKSVRFAWKR